ncbi:MAG: PLDc_N domain-containing protein [Gemmatimonadetes bacterium]|nr:PLDc_N domain-containing protein [Gemmatimonadota bacterium]
MPFGLGFGELLLTLLMLSGFLVWPWALVECLVRESGEGNTKIAWLLAILLAPFLGALLYLLVRRPRRISELGR